MGKGSRKGPPPVRKARQTGRFRSFVAETASEVLTVRVALSNFNPTDAGMLCAFCQEMEAARARGDILGWSLMRDHRDGWSVGVLHLNEDIDSGAGPTCEVAMAELFELLKQGLQSGAPAA